jgi:hypothetical protein
MTRLIWLFLYRIVAPVVNALLVESTLGEWIRRRLHWAERHFVFVTIPNPLRIDRQVLFWHTDAYWYAATLAARKYEPDTARLFKELLHSGMVVLDLGAHIGYFSLLAARRVLERRERFMLSILNL